MLEFYFHAYKIYGKKKESDANEKGVDGRGPLFYSRDSWV